MEDPPLSTAILLLFCLILLPIGESDLESDRATLINLRNFLGGRTLRWNTSLSSPCSWLGVRCDSIGVSELRLPGAGLSGDLPAGFGNLTRLQKLSLRFNALSGPIPADLGNLSGLSELHLEGNFFSGQVPDFLFGMKSLVRLNLADNIFSGEISPRFGNLKRLVVLYLGNNSFTGSIPDIDLPELDQFNVSFNRLNGSIPDKLARFSADSFLGNFLCGKPLKSCDGSGTGEKKDNKLSTGAIVGIVMGCVIGVLIILAILIFLCRRKEKGEKEIIPKMTEVEIPKGKAAMESESLSGDYSKVSAKRGAGGIRNLVFFGNTIREFDLEDLLRASAEVLGKGTFGTTYKASLEMGISVAVKRLKEGTAPEKEFRERMEQVGRMDHENLVPLRAYYYSRDEKLLVYDYLPMGSLSALLHGSNGAGRTPLNWETRSGIALGAARGIAYLHSHGSSHGNIKSSNILLTRSYEARVSDFGLAHLANPDPTPNHRVAGYRAPEVTDPHKVSPKADVYSFGVLLLELLTGKPPTHSQLNDEGVDLPRWVQSVVREEWTVEVFDLELLRYQNVEDEMVELLQLALDCTVQYPDKRPPMAVVTRRIEELCHSSSQREENVTNESFYGTDEGISQQYYSADSVVPPSLKD
ncbi:putative inactive receptor kinase [Morus notabilis]|uniref:Putative inactive receptor kinase n=1 Tax=Morus notabilis TaxID=981085 RepID=W9RS77_9ROSA|nr:probable inactive receptor kinase RLK902 [Morus notabilis]EXC05427.1 putative inactive receptor kinase [Morus notabilis]